MSDMKVEVVVIPVTDVDRARQFYGERLGWRLDADFPAGDSSSPRGLLISAKFHIG